MPYSHLVSEDLAETPHILTRETGIHFAVFAKLAAHQIVSAFHARHLKTERQQLNKYFSRNLCLGMLKKSFNIAHHRVKDPAFM